MKKYTIKTLLRSIKSSLGRYMAILAITALGVGFFTGLKSAQPSMQRTADDYLKASNVYDFQLVSSLGFTDSDVSAFENSDEFKDAEGEYGFDVLAGTQSDENYAYHLLSLPERISRPELTEGRLPISDNECVADSAAFTPEDIGKIVKISDDNSDNTLDMLNYTEFTIVGLVKSPRYISYDRGSTSLGSGNINGFIYVPKTAFESEAYHEILLKSDIDEMFFSDKYDDAVDTLRGNAEIMLNERAMLRYNDLYSEARTELDEAKAELDDGRKEFEDGKKELEEKRKELADGKIQLDEAKIELDNGRRELEERKKELEAAEKELADGKIQYEQAIASGIPESMLADTIMQLESAETQISTGRTAIKDAESELAKGEKELSENEVKLKDGETELQKAETELAEAEAELAEAEEKLNDGEAELANLKKPTTYLLTLNDNAGYAGYKNDIEIVDSVANVFPVFFILIAALVCVTTMTRMVNEERTQIGTLKSLGCSEVSIVSKYILYSGSAALIGCIGGYFIGTGVIPQVIWKVYGIMYGFASLQYYFSPVMYAACMGVAIFGTVFVTVATCLRELKSSPAELVRPKAPRNGKRILLEYVKPVWKRLSFLNKVTLRNAFRYKKRMIMMLLGIGGCTALIVTGFGLNDSIANILKYQYDEIILYDAAASFDKSADTAEIEALLSEHNADYALAYKENLALTSEFAEKEAAVVAISTDISEKYFNLHLDSEKISYPTVKEDVNYCVVSSKLAEQLGAETGDKITVAFDEQKTSFTVSAVCENYMNHYLYVPTEAVPNYFANTAFFISGDGEEYSAGDTAAKLRDIDGVAYVSVAKEERAIAEKSMSSMNYIILLIIVCAGALAFIVLYNLTNINIIERVREVATVKVLGFRPAETSSYVLRENLILSAAGAIIGLVMGNLLHRYVMLQIDVAQMTFDIRISPWSYILALLCTIAFAIITNLIMRFKLEKINMAESLKSVE